MSHRTGRRIVEMVKEDLKPSRILTRNAFENAIVVNTALGGSTNCPIHLTAIARHAGVLLELQDWQKIGYDIPLLVNCQPAGSYLGESFHRAGGVPAVMRELLAAGKLHGDCLSVAGQTIGEDLKAVPEPDRTVIRSYEAPLREKAGFLVLSGNLFEGGLIKTCVISDTFRKQYLSTPGEENSFTARCIVFEGPEDYHARIDDPTLEIDTSCLLAIRGCRARGVSRLGGSGEYAAAGRVDQKGCGYTSDHGRRPTKRHGGKPEHPEYFPGIRCGR